MTWVVFAFAAATLFSCTNIIDKYLIDKRYRKLSTTTITTIGALAGIPFAAALLLILRTLPSASTFLYGLVAGWLVLAGYQLYYKALWFADAALVTSLFQIILPFNYLFGLLFFQDKITFVQIAGMLIIVAAATIAATEQREKKWRLRSHVLVTMTLASFLLSLSDLVFKHVSESTPFLQIAATEYFSSILAGLLLLFFVPKVRRELRTLKKSFRAVASFSEFNEAFTFAGNLSLRYAISLGPIALVQGVLGAQPIIVLALSAVLGFAVPKLRQTKKSSFGDTLLKIGSMLLLVLGSFLITRSA